MIPDHPGLWYGQRRVRRKIPDAGCRNEYSDAASPPAFPLASALLPGQAYRVSQTDAAAQRGAIGAYINFGFSAGSALAGWPAARLWPRSTAATQTDAAGKEWTRQRTVSHRGWFCGYLRLSGYRLCRIHGWSSTSDAMIHRRSSRRHWHHRRVAGRCLLRV